jgi:CheY-like chemotaxis protein
MEPSPQVLPYFHPTRVVLVDDEPRILQMSALLLQRSPAVSGVRAFERALPALQWLHGREGAAPAPAPFEGARVRDVLAGDARTLLRTIDVSLAGLPRLLARSRAADPCSVVVSDFAMPGMDGLEFFGRLRDDGARRVLLTALCDDRSAVAAFNQGLIHRFLHKGDPRGPEALLETVRDQVHGFFSRRLAHLGAALGGGPGGQFLSHRGVPALLDRAMQEGGCREYCFCADPPGFHLGGGPCDSRFLVLADAAEFLRCARVVEEIEGDPALARALRARAVMPVACDGEAIYEHGPDWARRALAPRHAPWAGAGQGDLWWEQIDGWHGSGECEGEGEVRSAENPA